MIEPNKIGIIDAEIINKPKHRFPNLACMKISSYYKQHGWEVELITKINDLSPNLYAKIFISKVFQDTFLDESLLAYPNVFHGGTGFCFDNDGLLKKQPEPLPYDIEHSKPDYTLYNDWIKEKESLGANSKEFNFYKYYSIGFTTRGCFRKCWFCVNKYCNHAIKHSTVDEFLDADKKYILLLDDNILACSDWKSIFQSLNQTKKPFQYKQGLDERLLTAEKCDIIFNQSKWHGEYIFAFDNIEDSNTIKEKLSLIYKTSCPTKQIKFYVFCAGRNPYRKYKNFWLEDISDTFERIKILSSYRCLPYIMRFKDWKLSPYNGIYATIAAWCNQPAFLKKMSFRQFSIIRGMKGDVVKKYKNNPEQYLLDGYKKGASWRNMEDFECKHPNIASVYFDMRFEELNKQIDLL